jgi:hypothetical protein
MINLDFYLLNLKNIKNDNIGLSKEKTKNNFNNNENKLII